MFRCLSTRRVIKLRGDCLVAGDFSKDEYLEWCRNPVTERFIKEIESKVNAETWSLVENAGTNQSVDARTSGKIIAWGEVLNWKPEEFLVDENIIFKDGGDDSDD